MLSAICFLMSLSVHSSEDVLSLEAFRSHPPMAEVLLLGTFHFKDAGLDAYKPEVDIDILSERRQRELAEMLDRIAEGFRPTKIAIEARGAWAERIVSEEYPAWLGGQFELRSNEIYQIAFRLGRQLDHERLFPVDATGRAYEGLPTDRAAWAREHGQDHLLENEWHDRFMALYRGDDRAKAQRSLTETFLAMNDPQRLLTGHGHYLLGGIALGDEENYLGADHLTGWWYNRNLRIYAKIRRIAEPGDRILVLIGAGHVPIIRHAFDASPEFRLIEVAEVLAPE